MIAQCDPPTVLSLRARKRKISTALCLFLSVSSLVIVLLVAATIPFPWALSLGSAATADQMQNPKSEDQTGPAPELCLMVISAAPPNWHQDRHIAWRFPTLRPLPFFLCLLLSSTPVSALVLFPPAAITSADYSQKSRRPALLPGSAVYISCLTFFSSLPPFSLTVPFSPAHRRTLGEGGV